MAAYPTTIPYQSRIRPATKNRTRVAESGRPRFQSLSEVHAYVISVRHEYVTSSQRDTLQTFYNTNRYVMNTIVASDGNTYDFAFETDYEVIEVSALYYHMTCRLFANRQ